jgi:hypothetical protein
MTVADPRPAKRIKDPGLVRNFSQRASSCAVCGTGRGAGLSAHHVLPRGRGGDDVTATGCHGDVEHYRGDARKTLGLHLVESRPDVLEYLGAKLGTTPALVEFLDRSYGGKG